MIEKIIRIFMSLCFLIFYGAMMLKGIEWYENLIGSIVVAILSIMIYGDILGIIDKIGKEEK